MSFLWGTSTRCLNTHTLAFYFILGSFIFSLLLYSLIPSPPLFTFFSYQQSIMVSPSHTHTPHLPLLIYLLLSTVYCGDCHGLRMPLGGILLPPRIHLPFDVLLVLHWQEKLHHCTGILPPHPMLLPHCYPPPLVTHLIITPLLPHTTLHYLPLPPSGTAINLKLN